MRIQQIRELLPAQMRIFKISELSQQASGGSLRTIPQSADRDAVEIHSRLNELVATLRFSNKTHRKALDVKSSKAKLEMSAKIRVNQLFVVFEKALARGRSKVMTRGDEKLGGWEMKKLGRQREKTKRKEKRTEGNIPSPRFFSSQEYF